MAEDLTEKIHTLADWIYEPRHLVVYTGAGISTESGLPDFRGPDGVWTRRDKGLPPRPTSVGWEAVKPNTGHLSIVELQRLGKLKFLISQNVDNLHLKSGIDPERLAGFTETFCLPPDHIHFGPSMRLRALFDRRLFPGDSRYRLQLRRVGIRRTPGASREGCTLLYVYGSPH